MSQIFPLSHRKAEWARAVTERKAIELSQFENPVEFNLGGLCRPNGLDVAWAADAISALEGQVEKAAHAGGYVARVHVDSPGSRDGLGIVMAWIMAMGYRQDAGEHDLSSRFQISIGWKQPIAKADGSQMFDLYR